MAIAEWVERLGRAIFEAPFGGVQVSHDAPELAEIRLAVFDAVKAKSHRAGGRDVFPHNVVRLRIRGVPPDQSALFTGTYFRRFCEEELRGGLARSGYRFPADLEVEVETTPSLPGPNENWLEVDAKTVERQAASAQVAGSACISVIRGAANIHELELTKTRTNLGRTKDVFRHDGPSRRNDLAFDEHDEASRSVSREHAHILFSKKTGEFRLFNDRAYKASAKGGNCGLWILRDGLSHEVHRGARGVRLEDGDEIQLGHAVVKFTIR